MAVNGLVRDFTDDEKDDIEGIIKALNDEDSGFLNSIGDWFSDTGENIDGFFHGEYDVSDYLTDIDSYHKKIMDKKNTSIEQLNAIFEDVYQVDSDYKSTFSGIKDKITTLKDSVSSLADILDPTPLASGGEFKLAMSDFSVDHINDKLVKYYYDKFKEGKNNDNYNWDYIKKLAREDPKNVSEAEYAAMCWLIDEFSEGDEVDTENYNKFLNAFYINPKAGKDSGYHMYHRQEVDYELSPVFSYTASRYAMYSAAEVQSYMEKTGGKLYPKDSDFIRRKVFNMTVLENVYKYGKVGHKDGILDKSVDGGCLDFVEAIKLKKNSGSEADKFDYDLNLRGTGDYLIKTYNNGNELYDKIQGEEIKYLASGCDYGIYDMSVGFATIAAGFGPGALPYMSAYVCTVQALGAPGAAMEERKKYADLADARELGRALEGCQVSAAVTIDKQTVNINYATMNKEQLELLLYMYKDITGKEITVNDCENFLFKGDNSAKDKTMSYCNWYYDESELYIKEMMSAYSSMSQDFGGKEYEQLSLADKKKVYKRYKERINGNK